MGWERPKGEERRRAGRIPLAIALSLIAHALLLAGLLIFVRPPEIPPAPPAVVEVELAPRGAGALPSPAPTAAVATETAPARAATHAAAGAASARASAPATPAPASASAGGGGLGGVGAVPQPSATPRRGEGGYLVVAPGIEGLVGEHFRREREAEGESPAVAGPRDPRANKPGASVTDQLDGIADLGSGEPGDPRIPGAGPVEIGQVLARDAAVVASREHVAEGQMHPFLCDVKARIEGEWNPGPRDVASLANPEKIYDPVCAAGYHRRFKVARVLAVYDATGARIRFTVAGAPLARDLQKRVTKAVDDAGMHPPPRELLDDEGHMRLAWNVFLDDYTGCNLVGSDGRGHRANGMTYVIGVVELEGMF